MNIFKRLLLCRELLETYLQVLRQFILDTQHLHNVKVFGFDTEQFTNDLRLYKDPDHYHIAVNNFILEQIAIENCLLKPAIIDTYILAVDKKINSFRLVNRWNPRLTNTMPTAGYLSLEAARMLIESGDNYSDEKITNIALQDTPLPKCAANIKRNIVSRVQ